MRDRSQFIKFFLLQIALFACAAIAFKSGARLEEGSSLPDFSAPLVVVFGVFPALILVAISIWAAVTALMQFKKAYRASKAGMSAKEYKDIVHYTLPLAFPLAGLGFSFLSVIFAAILAYIIFKWGRYLYPWEPMKRILLHRDGVSWERTVITWINALFFLFAGFLPLLTVVIFAAIITGFLSGTGSGSGSNSSGEQPGNSDDEWRTCKHCAYYDGFECHRTNEYPKPNDSCSSFTT